MSLAKRCSAVLVFHFSCIHHLLEAVPVALVDPGDLSAAAHMARVVDIVLGEVHTVLEEVHVPLEEVHTALEVDKVQEAAGYQYSLRTPLRASYRVSISTIHTLPALLPQRADFCPNGSPFVAADDCQLLIVRHSLSPSSMIVLVRHRRVVLDLPDDSRIPAPDMQSPGRTPITRIG